MDEVAEVKSRLEITEVVGGYVPLKQAGRNLKAPCPFHQEKSASFMVSPEKGIYHCFGCGEGGDIFSFVMKMEGVDFRTCLEMLARKAGVELKARGSGDNGEAKRSRERLFAAHEIAVKYFQASLIQNSNAIEYIVKKRHLTKKIVEDFQIGYAPDSWNALSDFLQKKGFNQSELLRGGLSGQKEGSNTIYDLFRGRLTFTICDREGRPIGFTGRVLDDSLPKYLNTPQTALYDKSQAIYGLHLAKEAIRSANEVVLVEGNMDVVASHQAGVKQVVASSGTALTSMQLKTLSGLTKKVILAFDSDRAGLAATEKAVPLALMHGIDLYALQLTDAKDADELIQKDPGLWVDAIKGAKEIRDYWLDRGVVDFDLNTALGNKQFVDRMLGIARLYASTDQSYVRNPRSNLSVDQDTFMSKVAEIAKVDIATLRKALDDYDKNAREKAKLNAFVASRASDSLTTRRAVVQSSGKPSARRIIEESLLAMALMDPLTRVALDDLEARDFTTPEREAVFEAIHQNRNEPAPAIAKILTQQADYISILLLRGEQEFAELAPADRSFEAFGLARRLQIQSNKDIKQILSEKLREAEKNGDASLVGNLLKQYQAVIEEEG